MKRREFLSRAAAGSAILTMPAFLQGCGTQLASIVSEPPPENPFLTWFGVDESTVTQVMSALTSKGADFADAYFQHTRSSTLSFADSVVENAGSDIQQGVGNKLGCEQLALRNVALEGPRKIRVGRSGMKGNQFYIGGAAPKFDAGCLY